MTFYIYDAAGNFVEPIKADDENEFIAWFNAEHGDAGWRAERVEDTP